MRDAAITSDRVQYPFFSICSFSLFNTEVDRFSLSLARSLSFPPTLTIETARVWMCYSFAAVRTTSMHSTRHFFCSLSLPLLLSVSRSFAFASGKSIAFSPSSLLFSVAVVPALPSVFFTLTISAGLEKRILLFFFLFFCFLYIHIHNGA